MVMKLEIRLPAHTTVGKWQGDFYEVHHDGHIIRIPRSLIRTAANRGLPVDTQAGFCPYLARTRSNQSAKCDDCGRVSDIDDLDPYRDFWSRVDVGGTIPAGDCPECGAFAYLNWEQQKGKTR